MTKKQVKLEDLVGRHMLDVAMVMSRLPVDDDDWSEEVDVMSFGMDGKTYTATEDADDGYRSMLGSLEVEDGHTTAILSGTHIEREVEIKYFSKYPDTKPCNHEWCDIIRIIDVQTKHIWLELGTDHSDKYYPFCIMRWSDMPFEKLTKECNALYGTW